MLGKTTTPTKPTHWPIRAINNFTPGSTFKLPTAIAAAIHGHAYDTEYCPGYITYGDIKIHCWKRLGHGQLNLEESIQRSCNCYFMRVANEIGSTKMLDTFQLLGLGSKTGLELPSESAGFIPGSRYWRQELRPGAKGNTIDHRHDVDWSIRQRCITITTCRPCLRHRQQWPLL